MKSTLNSLQIFETFKNSSDNFLKYKNFQNLKKSNLSPPMTVYVSDTKGGFIHCRMPRPHAAGRTELNIRVLQLSLHFH